MLGIIGGSGLDSLEDLEVRERRRCDTPYGAPSAAVSLGHLGGVPVAFLARHGDGHTIAPHEINYRANLWALRDCGVRQVAAVLAVGGIGASFPPGDLVVPDQIVDYTWGRRSTFFEGAGSPVRHIDFTRPYDDALRGRLLEAARQCGQALTDGATYGATQGPRLETAAEIDRLERDGCDLVGMTGMPEAALARELGLDYAALAVVINAAAGRAGSAQGIAMDEMEQVMANGMQRVRRILRALAEALAQ
jgi:5'-methylthioadenosine phosphorylase